MSINAIATSIRNSMCDDFVDAYDAGSTDAGGDYDGYTTGYGTLLFSCLLSAPAYGASASGIATAAAIGDDISADATGAAADGRAKDRDNTLCHDFSIGTSGEDLNLNTVLITIGDTVSITSATATMPAA